jgi:anthranilate synthase component 2
MILIIDNYDSFTYNLVQLVGSINPHLLVLRPDELQQGNLKELAPSHIILAPGSGRPQKDQIKQELKFAMDRAIPLLGIGFGHQAICVALRASLIKAGELAHGQWADIHVANGSPLFRGLAPIIKGAMYHSLLVHKMSLPDELLVIAEDKKGEVMGVKHRDYEIYGLQFHPESLWTPQGPLMIKNFLQIGGETS